MNRAWVTGVLVGVGIAGFVDQAVLHQILQWHTFYWGTTLFGRLLSDGLFHVVADAALIAGMVLLWRDARSWEQFRRRRIFAWLLVGAGAFNLYDGLVQHALLHLHLVNEKVCPIPGIDNTLGTCPRDIPYEIVFDVLAAAIVATGATLLARLRRESSDTVRP